MAPYLDADARPERCANASNDGEGSRVAGGVSGDSRTRRRRSSTTELLLGQGVSARQLGVFPGGVPDQVDAGVIDFVVPGAVGMAMGVARAYVRVGVPADSSSGLFFDLDELGYGYWRATSAAVYPFLYILVGAAAMVLLDRDWRWSYLLGALLCWQVVTSVRVSPAYMAYGNEAAVGRRRWIAI